MRFPDHNADISVALNQRTLFEITYLTPSSYSERHGIRKRQEPSKDARKSLQTLNTQKKYKKRERILKMSHLKKMNLQLSQKELIMTIMMICSTITKNVLKTG